MKYLLLALCIPAVAVPAAAQQGGLIAPYSDPLGECCIMYETVGTINDVYIVHTGIPEAAAVAFRVQSNWANAVFIEALIDEIFLGDIFTGITVSYDGCAALPRLVATLRYLVLSPTPSNENLMSVEPSLLVASGEIEVTDCNDDVVVAVPGRLYINIDYIPMGCLGCLTVPTDETTWGKVKSLYQ